MKKLSSILLIFFVYFSMTLNANPPLNYPEGELGRIIKLGENIMNNTDTHPLTKNIVGNSLKCKNCHLAGTDGITGTSKAFGSLIGSAITFPAFSQRSKKVITLQERINDCFMRSMHGKETILDSEASIALVAYISWLSSGLPLQMNERYPMSDLNIKIMKEKKDTFVALQKKATHENFKNGKNIFETKCAVCHQKNGKGLGMFPPLFGSNKDGEWLAYNSGAGMSKLHNSAIWIQSNMPLGQGDSLNDQDAADVALFINGQARADFIPNQDKNHSIDINTVRKNFKEFGLDIDVIRSDKLIPLLKK